MLARASIEFLHMFRHDYISFYWMYLLFMGINVLFNIILEENVLFDILTNDRSEILIEIM